MSTRIEALATKYGVDLLSLFEMFLERSAIREYEAGMPRDEAEEQAVGDCEEWARSRCR